MFEFSYVVGGVVIFVLLATVIWRGQVSDWWASFWNRAAEIAPNVSRQKQVAVISIVGSLVAIIATYFWLKHFEDASAEPKSQFVIAIAWFIVSVLQMLIPSDPEWEIIHAKRARHEQGVLEQVLDRLRKERLNFDQIISRNGLYNSNAHKKAVEVDSFELLLSDIRELKSIPKFRRKANAIAKEIERNQALDKKIVDGLIVLLNEIETRLQNEIERLGRIHRGLT